MSYESRNIPLAKKLRKDMTPWERKLWYCFLSKYPIRFQRQKPIGKYIVDFYCASSKLVVELDGGGHYEPEAMQKDDTRTRMLQKQGYTVIRFCNKDIDKNFYGVCCVIEEAVKSGYRRELPQSDCQE